MIKRYKKYMPPQGFDKIQQLWPKDGKKATEITFQITDDCCMACTYCYQHNKNHHVMKLDDAKLFIDKLLNNEYPKITTDNTMYVFISFIGGEPFMESKLIYNIWEYWITQLIKLNHPWLFRTSFNICSNGLLYFSKDTQRFINKYGRMGEVTFSIDGNKQLHDSCRVDLCGNGTYDRAVAAMKAYSERFNKMPSTKMTLSPSNIKYTKEAIINLINLGYTDIYANCIFEEGWTAEHAKIYYYQLKDLADYLINNELNERVYISIFNDEYGYRPLEESDNQNYCGGTAEGGLAIDWQGNFFPCLRYMESSLNGKQEPLDYGTIENGSSTSKRQKENFKLLSNITRRSCSEDKCFYCPIAEGCAYCSGYCYEYFGTPNKRTTFTCQMQQAQALANWYYWNKIYKKYNINKNLINHVPKSWDKIKEG